jgi:integrase
VPMFEAESRREVFFEPEEWERFLGAFDDETAWKSYRTRLRNLGPVKEGLQGLRRYGGGRNPDSEATAEYRERLRATVPFFRTMLYTGSRPSEVLRLTWQDIDFERGRVFLWQEKTRAAKTVPMSKALREVLSALPRGIGGARVFVRPDSVPLTLPEVARAFRVAQKLSGIREELNPYTIRHTFASWLAIKGTPIRTIQELLGHKDLRMTLRYAHLSPAHLAEAVETIGTVEKSNRLRVGCASKESGEAGTEAKPFGSSGSPYENRTRISALRGPRPNR